MGKLVSRGYEPSPEELLRLRREDGLFRENFRLILSRQEEILARSDYFYCTFGSAWLSIAYIGPGGTIPLGALLLLWRWGQLIEKCPSCGGKVYIAVAGGSPLSGSHNCHGVCAGCGNAWNGRVGCWMDVWLPITKLLNRLRCRKPGLHIGPDRSIHFAGAKVVDAEGEDVSDGLPEFPIPPCLDGPVAGLETVITALKAMEKGENP
ncbi:MAG: hypothetical protein V1809_14635 [Planctomycetota bacterium]